MPDELASSPPRYALTARPTTTWACFATGGSLCSEPASPRSSPPRLHECGAKVQLVARRKKLSCNGQPLPLNRPLLQRIREPEVGLGSGWGTWFYSLHPELFRHLPEGVRVQRAKTALGPAGACWLPDA